MRARRIKYDLLLLVLISSLLAQALVVTKAQLPDYTIDGDTVYIDTPQAYLAASPHTSMGGWVYLNLTSKQYSGSLDVAFGYDSEVAKPRSLDIWSWKEVSERIPDPFFDNTTYYKYNHTAELTEPPLAYNGTVYLWTRIETLWDEATNSTWEVVHDEWILVYSKDFSRASLTEREIYWNVDYWRTVANQNFNFLSYEHGGVDRWYYTSFDAQAGMEYYARVWLDVSPSLEGGLSKYWVAVKPSSESIQQAIVNGHLYALDPWYDWNWDYRKSHTINGSSAGAQTDYQVKVIVDYSLGTDSGNLVYLNSKCKTDFGDIRFTNSSGGDLLDYFIFEQTDSDTATIWVEVDDIPEGPGTAEIYIYYGNAAATTTSNGVNTFIFFDDFETNDFSKWDTAQSAWGVVATDPKHGTYHARGNLHATDRWLSVDFGTARTHVRFLTWFQVYRAAGNAAFYIYHSADYAYPIDSRVGHFQYYDGSWHNWPNDKTYTQGVWYRLEVEIDCTYDKVKAYIDDFYLGEITPQTIGDDTEILVHLTGTSTYYDGAYFDDDAVGKLVYPEPIHDAWGTEEEAGVAPPTITSATSPDRDDTDNAYEMESYYTFVVVVNDETGATDIDEVHLLGTQVETVRFEVRATDLTGTPTWTIQTGATIIDLDTGSCTWGEVGNVGTATFKIRFEFDFTDEADLELRVYVEDAGALFAGPTTQQTNYLDVIGRLVISNLAVADGRIDRNTATTFGGNVYYATTVAGDTPSAKFPLDAQFTAVHIHDSAHSTQGNDATIVNGAFSGISVTVPDAVQSNTYHVYLDLVADYTDADAPDGDTAAVIGDEIVFKTATTLEVDAAYHDADNSELGLWYAELMYDFDDAEMEAGTVTLNTGAMSWDAGDGRWEYTVASATVQSLSRNIATVSGSAHGITALNTAVSGDSESVQFDKVKCSGIAVSDARDDIGDTINIDFTLIYESDSAQMVDGTVTIEGEATAHQGSGVWRLGDSEASVQENTYNEFTATGNTRAIDTENQNGQSDTAIWDRIHCTATAASDNRDDLNDNVDIDYTLKYDFDEADLTDGTVTIETFSAAYQGSGVWRITRTSASVTSVTYNEFTATANTHGITEVNMDGEGGEVIVWDRIEIVSVAFDDSRANIGATVEARYALRYDYDDVVIDSGKATITGWAWDVPNSWWDKAVTAPATPVAELYDEDDISGSFTDDTYALTIWENDAGANLVGDRINFKTATLETTDDHINSDATGEWYAELLYEYDNAEVTDGTVTLDEAGGAYFGSQYRGQSVSGEFFDAPGDKFAVRFTAQEDKSVENISLYVARAGSLWNATVGIQGDNGGEPDGTYIGANDITINGTVVNDTNWWSFTLASTVPLTDQTVYHVVVDVIWADDTHNIYFRGTHNRGGQSGYNRWLTTHDMDDANLRYEAYQGASWALRTRTPIFIITYTDGSFIGQPYTSVEIAQRVYGSNFHGQWFWSPDDKITINTLGIYIRKQNSPGDLNISLETESGVILRSVIILVEDGYPLFDWEDGSIEEIELNASTLYRLRLRSPGGDSGNFWDINHPYFSYGAEDIYIDDASFGYNEMGGRESRWDGGWGGAWYFDDLSFRLNLIGGSMEWDSGDGRFEYTNAPAAVVDVTRNIASISGNTYGITALNSAVTSDSETIEFDEVVFISGTMEVTDAHINSDATGEWYVMLMLDNNNVAITSGTITLNTGAMSYDGGQTRWEYTNAPGAVVDVARNIASVSGLTGGITKINAAVTGDSETIEFDEVVFLTGTFEVIDGRINYDATGEWYAKLMLDNNDETITSGTITLNTGAMTYDSGADARWEYTNAAGSVTSVSRNIASVSGMTGGITKVNAAVSGDSEAIIFDEIIFKTATFEVADGRINSDNSEVGQWYVELMYDYDDTEVVDGSVTLNTGSLSWEATSGRWEYNLTSASVQAVTRNIASISGNVYGITVLDSSVTSDSETIVFDQIVAYLETLNDTRTGINTYAQWRISAVLEYDDHLVGSGDTLVSSWDSLTWDAGNSWWEIDHTEAAIGVANITLSSGTEDTYGISLFTENITEANVIYDRIRIDSLAVVDARISTSSVGTYYLTATLEYDGHSLGDGDWLSIGGYNFTWNSVESRLEHSRVETTVGLRTINSYTSGDEATYGIYVGDINGKTAGLIWDRIKVYWEEVDEADNRTNIDDNVEWRVRAVLEYDEHALGSPDYLTTPWGSTSWDGTNTWHDLSHTESSVGAYTISFLGGWEGSYGITSATENITETIVIFDRIIVTLSANVTSPDAGDVVGIIVIAWYDYDDVILPTWTFHINRNGSYFTMTPTTDTHDIEVTYQYTIKNVTEAVYDIDVLSGNTLNIQWANLQIDIFNTSIPDLRVGTDTSAIIYWNARYGSNNSVVSSGNITVGGVTYDFNGTGWAESSHTNSSVGSYDYSVDAVWVEGETDFTQTTANPNLIFDRVRITSLSAPHAVVDINETITIVATADLQYDTHALGDGDTLVIEGETFTWNASQSKYTLTKIYDNAEILTLDDLTTAIETTYGITSGTMNDFSLTVEWRGITGGAPGVPSAPTGPPTEPEEPLVEILPGLPTIEDILPEVPPPPPDVFLFGMFFLILIMGIPPIYFWMRKEKPLQEVWGEELRSARKGFWGMVWFKRDDEDRDRPKLQRRRSIPGQLVGELRRRTIQSGQTLQRTMTSGVRGLERTAGFVGRGGEVSRRSVRSKEGLRKRREILSGLGAIPQRTIQGGQGLAKRTFEGGRTTWRRVRAFGDRRD